VHGPDVYSEVVGLVGFDRGYVAYGNSDLGPWASTSADGRTWHIVPLANLAPACGATDGRTYPDADLVAGATNRHEIVLVGAEQLRDQQACADVKASIRAMVWASVDGRTWGRSTQFADLGRSNSRGSQVWAIPGGWHALVDEPVNGTASLWESTDAVGWLRVTLPGGQTWTQLNEQKGFLALGDGQTWRPVTYPAACDQGSVVFPPPGSSVPWILIRGRTSCASSNLIDWQSGAIGAPVGWNLFASAHTGNGIIVTGSTTDCMCAGASQYASPDGLAWAKLSSGVGISQMADGPAGVVGLSGFTDGLQTVWLLER
jgi:hypothetical protein